MNFQFRRPSTGRIIAALFSLYILRLPQLLPGDWTWVVVGMILVFFLILPDLKGVTGGLVAGFFSLVFAGLGQLYVRQYIRGFSFIFCAVFAYMISGYSSKSWIFNNVLFIVAAIDAFSLGKRDIGIF